MIDVSWLSLRDDVPAHGMWDQHIVEMLLDRLPWPIRCTDVRDLIGEPGGVVVVTGGGHAELVDQVNAEIARLPWCVLIITSDEGSMFPVEHLHHPAMRVWVQNPRTDRHGPDIRPLPVGPTPHAARAATLPYVPDKTSQWMFAGQVTHRRRLEAVKALRELAGGTLIESAGFTQGIGRDQYIDLLIDAKVAPSPAGIVTPDTFRAWEALTCGAIPIVDIRAGEWEVPGDYWLNLCGGLLPAFPTVSSWRHTRQLIGDLVDGWPRSTVIVQAWWLDWLDRLAGRLAGDIAELSGGTVDRGPITVLVPTSPIPSHPSTDVLDATLASIRDQLPDARIVIMADGVRPEQDHRRGDYDEYLRRVLWHVQHRDRDVTLQLFPGHHHQAAMTRATLDAVDTPCVLFVEHDTPLEGDIDWDGIVHALTSDRLDLVRLHYDVDIHPDHRHLMVDEQPVDVGVPVIRTVQWSQRPHVATVGYYRRILADHFTAAERWMIEDRMHSVVQSAWTDDGLDGWQRHRLGIYRPDGSMKRSGHLDGRGDDPKWIDR